MRDRLIKELLKIPFSQLTGDPKNRLPGTASFVFECVEGEAMILLLDNAGICASSGSACSSASLDPSHVLLAIGLKHEVAHGSLRLSINETTTDEDIDYIIETLPPIIQKLRSMSPLWEDKMMWKSITIFKTDTGAEGGKSAFILAHYYVPSTCRTSRTLSATPLRWPNAPRKRRKS